MDGKTLCEAHFNETFRKKVRRKEKKEYVPPKRPSQLFQEVLSSNFPGKFEFRKVIRGSQEIAGAEIDAYMDLPKFALIIELEENQHKPPKSKIMRQHYMWQPDSQAERYINLVYKLLEKPTLVIRLNPNDIRKFNVKLIDRLIELCDLIQTIIRSPPSLDEMIRVSYMYFDKEWQETLEKALRRQLRTMKRRQLIL
jgi:hypothetical protein